MEKLNKGVAAANVAGPGAVRKGWVRRAAVWTAVAVAGVWLLAVVLLVVMKWVDPPTTMVQMERRVQGWFGAKPYEKQQTWEPLGQISPQLQHAVISSEDGRFYMHHGFDWEAIQKDAEKDMEGGRLRGGSTITQQLVKNLFFGTGRSWVRKGAETTLVPVAEVVLGKQRILEIYLNVVEWGPGVYGAEAACRNWDRVSAKAVSRDEAARLAAILPAPRKRHPERMNGYSGIILERMRQVGW